MESISCTLDCISVYSGYRAPPRKESLCAAPSNFCSGLSCFDSDLYWLLCLDPGFISCVCSHSSLSDITQIPWYPQTLFLSLIYTDHTLRHTQLQHGAFFQPASAKAPKSSTWDVLQHLQSPYKNFPHSFLSLFKATSTRSQMHKAQVVQDSMQCREGRAGDLATPENLFFSTDPNLWSPLLSSQSQNCIFFLPPHSSCHLLLLSGSLFYEHCLFSKTRGTVRVLPPKQQPARSPGDAPSTLPAAARARGLLKGQGAAEGSDAGCCTGMLGATCPPSMFLHRV